MIGIILSSKLIDGELQVDFGQISPAELPLANSKLFVHQYNELSKYCDDVYITVTESSRAKFREGKEIIYKNKLTLIELIADLCKRFASEDLLILYGDTLIEFGEIKVGSEIQIFCSDSTIHYPNWYRIDENKFMSGAILIPNCKKDLVLNIKQKEINLFLNELISESKLTDIVRWLDFGHSNSYYASKKDFLESRSFNSINYSQDGFIEKSSSQIYKIIYEFNWLNYMHRLYPTLVPEAYSLDCKEGKGSYKIEYFNYPTIAEIFVFGKHHHSQQIIILEKLIEFLKIMHDSSFSLVNEKNSNYNFIKDKLEVRKKDILNDCDENIFSKKVINKLIEKNLEYFNSQCFKYSLMHGDFCFSNILYNRRNNNFKLIDPRGYLSKFQGFSPYGPSVYDYLKLAHSYVCKYDWIIAGETEKVANIKEINDRLSVFSKLSSIDEELLRYGIQNLFLSMIPLHKECKLRQSHFFKIAKILV